MSDCSIPQSPGAAVSGTALAASGTGVPPAAAAPQLRRPAWDVYAVLMLLLGTYQGISAIMANPGLAPWKPFTWEMSNALMPIVLIPLILHWERRIRVEARPDLPMALARIAGAVGFACAHLTGMIVLRKLVYAAAGDVYSFPLHGRALYAELQRDLVTFVLILAVVVAARQLRILRAGELKARALASELALARLKQLTVRLQPAFLRNSLQEISRRMQEDVEAADRMICHLCDLLRAAYKGDEELLVPLGCELDWVEGYAAMMSAPCSGTLSLEVRAQPGLECVRVPRLLLQPLLESVLTHGLTARHGRIQVEVVERHGQLLCTVRDDSAEVPGGAGRLGAGLAEITRRLELLFPQQHSLDVHVREPCGFEVRLRFPALPGAAGGRSDTAASALHTGAAKRFMPAPFARPAGAEAETPSTAP